MNIHSPARIVALSLIIPLTAVKAADVAPSPVNTNSPAAPSSSAAAVPPDVQAALQMPEGKERVGALVKAEVAWGKQDPRAALASVLAQPNTASSNSAVRAVANGWGDSDPVAAKDWLMSQYPSIKDGSKDAQLPLLAFHIIVTAWARKDSAAASTWAVSQPADSPLNYTIYFSVADGWAQKEPAGAGAWAAKLPAENNRRIAVAKVGDIWARGQKKPEDAAAWAEKLPPADMKYAVPGIVNAWAQTDAAKAKAWVNGLPLSDADKADVLAKVK